MSPVAPTTDFYAVLEISQDADQSVIKSNYRRLAKIRHPDKAHKNANATAEFQVLQQAYSTLSDPDQRTQYDKIYASLPKARTWGNHAQENTQKEPAASKRHNATTEPDLAGCHERLRVLRSHQVARQSAIGIERCKAGALRAEVNKLTARTASCAVAKTSWSGLLASFVFGSRPESAEDKLKRERLRLDCASALNIKEHQLNSQEAAIAALEVSLHALEANIRAVQHEIRAAEIEQQQKEYAEQVKRADTFRAWMAEQVTQRAKTAHDFEKLRREQDAAAAAEMRQQRKQEAESKSLQPSCVLA